MRKEFEEVVNLVVAADKVSQVCLMEVDERQTYETSTNWQLSTDRRGLSPVVA